MVKLVQISGNLFMGDIQPENPDIMKNPRIVIIVPMEPDKYNIVVTKLIGEPDEIEIHNKSFSYNADGKILDRYEKSVASLVLAHSSLKEKMN
jgi:hypothetical protein